MVMMASGSGVMTITALLACIVASVLIIIIMILITDDKGLRQELTSPEQIMYS